MNASSRTSTAGWVTLAIALTACASTTEDLFVDDSLAPAADESAERASCGALNCPTEGCATSVIAGSQSLAYDIVVQDGWVYWSTDNGVSAWSMAEGGAPHTIVVGEYVNQLAVTPNNVFWVRDSRDLRHLTLDTAEVRTLATLPKNPNGSILDVAADQDHVYYGFDGMLLRQDVAGGLPTTLMERSQVTQVTLTDSAAYATACGAEGVARVDKATTALETIHATAGCLADGIAVDAHHAYFVELLERATIDHPPRFQLQRAPVAGGTMEIVGTSDGVKPALDECFVYFSESRHIFRLPKQGLPQAKPELVVSNAFATSIAITDTAVFWTTPGDVQMLRKP